MAIQVDRKRKPRRLTKTLLQSHALADSTKIYYEAGFRQVNKELDDIVSGATEGGTEKILDAFKEMEKEINMPWVSQGRKRRQHAPAHWNQQFIKFLSRKKLLCNRIK